MSYGFTIAQEPIPSDDEAARLLISQLSGTPDPNPPAVYHRLIDCLTERYPCLCDLDDDVVDELGVWSDGPLRNNIFLRAPVLGLLLSRVVEVMPFVIDTANDLGLTVFDHQDEQLYRPQSTAKR